MTVERKITSRHGIDSQPLSEWLRRLERRRGVRAASLCEDLRSNPLCGREEVLTRLSCRPRGIMDGYRDHGFTSQFHGNNGWCREHGREAEATAYTRRNQNSEYSYDSVHRRTARP
jgi:hypothetical protein